MNNPNTSPVETHEELDTSAVEQTGNDIANLGEAAEDVSKALVTLESIATAIESAPALTALEAKVANATIARIDAQFELPTRTVGLESATDPRKAALEDLSSKIETFKKTIGAIVAKIIEMVQKFWEWLTLNSKNIKKRLENLQAQLKNHSGKVDVPVTGSFKALTSEVGLSYDSISDVAAELHALLPVVVNFARESSPLRATSSLNGLGFSALKAAAQELKDYPQNDNAYVLYKNIGGRSLQVVFDPEIITKAVAGKRNKSLPYQVKISAVQEQAELPTTVSIDNKQVLDLIQDAIAVVGMADKHFVTINGEVKNLKHEERWVGKSDSKEKIAILRAYSQATSVFIDGVFTQSLRYSTGVIALTNAYTKVNTNNVIENAA